MGTTRPYTRIARLYDLLDLPFEYSRYRHIRPHLFDGLSGKILDAGVGTGRNMGYYPADADMTGIDLSPSMLQRAIWRRENLRIPVQLAQMNALETAFPDGHFNAIVATFLFCVLPPEHQLPALRELARICRPGGTIHILEYAYSETPWRRFIMRLWAPWVRFMYGAAFDRETEQYVDEAGLELLETRFLHHDIIKLLVLRPKA